MRSPLRWIFEPPEMLAVDLPRSLQPAPEDIGHTEGRLRPSGRHAGPTTASVSRYVPPVPAGRISL